MENITPIPTEDYLNALSNEERAGYEASYDRGRSLGHFVGAVYREQAINEALTEENRRLHYEATHDSLTGLLNIGGLNEYLDLGVLDNCAVLYIDATNLKAVNDLSGHEAGDKAIIGTAEVLQKAIAELLGGSLRPHDLIARIGGDEMLVILEPMQREGKYLSTEEQLELVKDRIIEKTEAMLKENPELAGHKFNIAVGGVIGKIGATIESLKAGAEQEMVAHKRIQHGKTGAYRKVGNPQTTGRKLGRMWRRERDSNPRYS